MGGWLYDDEEEEDELSLTIRKWMDSAQRDFFDITLARQPTYKENHL
jgi:hypothetical protein